MLCLRCIRSTLGAFSQPLRQITQTSPLQKRSLSILSHTPSRPSLPAARSSLPASGETVSAFQPPTPSLLQVRGAKRDTFNPSHRIRKRRHGFLSRLKTRTGRMILKRRRLKGRNTLSH